MVIETQVEVRGISPCLFSETNLPVFSYFSSKMTKSEHFNQKFNSVSHSCLAIIVHCSYCFFRSKLQQIVLSQKQTTRSHLPQSPTALSRQQLQRRSLRWGTVRNSQIQSVRLVLVLHHHARYHLELRKSLSCKQEVAKRQTWAYLVRFSVHILLLSTS